MSLLHALLATICIGLFAGCSATVETQPPEEAPTFFLTESPDKSISLNPYLSYLSRAPAETDFATVYGELRLQFQPWKSDLAPNFGYSENPIWIKLSIQSKVSDAAKLVLEILNADLENVDFYLVNHTSGVPPTAEVHHTDIGFTSGEGNASDTFQRLPRETFDLEPHGQIEIFLRIKSESSIWLPVTLTSKSTSGARAIRRLILDQPFHWFTAFASFLSIILALAFRNVLYFYNSILFFCHFIYNGISEGYIRNFLHIRNGEILPRFLIATSLLSFFAIALIIQSYHRNQLTKRPEWQLIARILTLLPVAILPICMDATLIPARYCVHTVAITTFVLLTPIVFVCTQKPYRWNQIYFICAWIFLAISSIWFHLILLGEIPCYVAPDTLERASIIPIISLLFIATTDHLNEFHRTEQQLARAMEAESRAKLAALRYQINPHFLFNTLTSIDALSRVAPQRIPILIERLADFLRPRLEPNRDQLISLSLEIKSIQSYLEIEQIRFGNCLQTTWCIPEEAMNYCIPDNILQPIVENAIKHRASGQADIKIDTVVRVDNQRLIIEISNEGSLPKFSSTDNASRDGIGLENVRQRIFLHFGERGKLSLEEVDGHVFCRLSFPAMLASA